MPPKKQQNRSKSHGKSSKEAAEIDAMAECVLPRDMMLDILSRLPAKSLVRFQCVCKPWRSLLSSPIFIKLHSSHGAAAARARAVESFSLTLPVLGLDSRRLEDGEIVFLEHCKGMICMARPSFTQDVILWNPATNFSKTLPRSRATFGAAEMVSLGFGCNADADDFKVIRIFSFKGMQMKVSVEVYSSKADCWRTLDLAFTFRVRSPKNHVIVNGNPCWVACVDQRYNEFGMLEEGSALLQFNATNVEFEGVSLPSLDILGEEGGPFVNWEGSIATLICVKRDGGDWLEGIDVWCYDENEWVWSRKKRFVMRPDLHLQVDRCIDCSSSSKIVGGCMNGRLFMFDPETGRVTVSRMNKGRGWSFQVFGYDESLAYVKEMGPAPFSKRGEKLELNDVDDFFVSTFCHRNGEAACYYALAQ